MPGGAAGPQPGAAETTATPEEIRAQLARILASEEFVSSQRLCRFLRFIVERALDSEGERLKEFVIAVEVFDRGGDYDPSIDSIVRVEARRLRTKLKSYYEGPGNQDPVHVSLRPGNYLPVFSRMSSPPVSVAVSTTVAVLPFVNMSPEPEQDYFCDGITEEIINALAAIDTLSVVARTSVFQFKGQAVDVRTVGERLGAQILVEGSVRKAGVQLRITAQVIDACNGYHLWSETYSRELVDIFAIQEEISVSIARTLQARLPARALASRNAYQPDLEAYTGFFRALYRVHQKDLASLQAALQEFRELTRRFPGYAEPYAGIATAYAAMALFGAVSGREILPELRRHAEHAVRLNPDSAAGWTVMGGISGHWEFDWQEAERRFRHAISLQPSNYGAHTWFGVVLSMLGRFQESEAELDIALKLDPLNGSGYARKGIVAYLRGDERRAISYLNDSLRMTPDYPDSRLVLALVHMQREDHRAAVEILAPSAAEDTLPAHLGVLVAAYHRWGKREEARLLLARLDELAHQRYVTPMARACAYLGMDDLDGCFEAISAAVEERAIFAGLLQQDPFWKPLQRDSRFEKLLTAMNLPR